MDAEEKRAIELIQEANQRIKTVVNFLMKRYGQMVIAICKDYVDEDIAQTLAAEVISNAVRTLDSYQGDKLTVPLYQTAEQMAKAKRDSIWNSMQPDLWDAERERQEKEGKVSKEDYALLRYKKHTNLTWKEIGQLKGMTEGQAKVRAHRAARKLLSSED